MTIALLACQLLAQSSLAEELFVDPAFQRGFTLTAASHPAPKVELGTLQTTAIPALEPPAWRMPQWATRFLLEPGVCRKLDDHRWGIENPGKRVELEFRKDRTASLLLEVRGGAEYDGRTRAAGEPWPHLLIEQGFKTPLRLDAFKSLAFAVDMRVPHCAPAAGAQLDRGLHTAQVSAYWTVHNMTEGNPDHGDMIWFGIPMFDVRYENPPAHYAIDGGKADASHKFICLLDGKRFWTGNTGDGKWRKLNADLLALMREGLSIAQEHGHLKNTRFEDIALTSFNLGWEVTGPYDATFEFSGLSMKGERK